MTRSSAAVQFLLHCKFRSKIFLAGIFLYALVTERSPVCAQRVSHKASRSHSPSTALSHLRALNLHEPLQSHKLSALTGHFLHLSRRDGRPICNASDFGAVGNGEVYDTVSIQATIDACASKGGGVVHIPPGIYLTATIYLRSNITFWIDERATILGSPLQRDFPAQMSQWYTILAENAENVELTGGGVVKGQGLKFVVEFKEEKNVMVSWNTTGACLGDECRPRLTGFINCKNVHIWNVSFEEPPYWW